MAGAETRQVHSVRGFGHRGRSLQSTTASALLGLGVSFVKKGSDGIKQNPGERLNLRTGVFSFVSVPLDGATRE